MAKMDDTILCHCEDGTEAEFQVLSQTTMCGIDYLLVCDCEDTALILEKKEETEGEWTYCIVEDDEKLLALSKLFEELVEDTSLEL